MKALLLALLLVTPLALAETYHTTLLTVSGDEWTGGVADAYLEIKPGTGRIFMDSFPITKTDTQFSTRYANEVACEFLRADCDKLDFFYTIRAESTIVGGPSAGAALTILTVAALDKQDLRQDVAMTGTINSGGVVGPVAGIVPKANAARTAGLSMVVVPTLATLTLNESNLTTATNEFILANLSDESFSVVQATDLYEALPYFIDKEYPPPTTELNVPASYATITQTVAQVLCDRRDALILRNRASETNRSQEIGEEVVNALEREAYYSAASFCFTQNIELQRESLEDLRPAALRMRLQAVTKELVVLNTLLDQENLTSISDVETQAIVRERVVEAAERLRDMNASNISVADLAFIIERTFSAQVWADFFLMESPEYQIDNEHLRSGCLQKIAEAEERITYIETFLPVEITRSSREQLALARRDLSQEDYSVCLFKAAKAKAEANVMTSVIAVSEDHVDLLVDEKLAAVQRVLSRQAELGLFPIMGYSYYEYAQSLAGDQPYSALTFAEYSLELSNLHVFFPQEERWGIPPINWSILGSFIFGILVGMTLLILMRKSFD